MKFSTLKHKFGILLCGTCLTMSMGLMVSCDDDDTAQAVVVTADPFDPSKPVLITGFTPENGGYQDQIIIKGSNFGNDKTMVDLRIGGKKAVIVNVLSDKLYAYVPSGAFTGEVELTITDANGNTHYVKADKIFKYDPKTVVGSLCGYRNENDDQGEVWGSFDICCGFRDAGCMAFDPLYPERLYIAYDRGEGFVAELDLDKREYTRIMSANKFQNQRLRNIAFSKDNKYMLVSTDRADHELHSTSVWIVTRNADGTFSDRSSIQPLVAYKQCNGVAVHPVNGEVYFNSYENGQLFRMELQDYFDAINGITLDPDGEPVKWTGYKEDGAFKELFRIMDPSYEFQITIHPTGDYAYITVINRNYILRTDYDWDKEEFTTPYVIAGYNEGGSGSYADGVGTSARFAHPYQGVFVKNPDYVGKRADEYDYYLADRLNFCVRYITPDGLVRTYAGRSTSSNGNIWGTEDGDLRQAARFRDVSGIAYDEADDRFYVLDDVNHRIRTIGKEDAGSNTGTDKPSPDPEPESGN
ncbi:IPT/TIG domain-containing protein [uncultured Muribaculum sp.]|uniref:IPT/TIG domain-containing protein n=1 Tax=uncultured Muribaculum sp. TaxID=1918613 RepID=UPI0025E8F9D5|nr:IPT/TIG domain-containing protein [uncultured Muribaculum sp.]